MYGRPFGTDKEQSLDGKLYIINQLPKGKKKKCLVCLPKRSNSVKKQTVFYCNIRPMNANPVCIPMNVLKYSTHYSIIININIIIKIILLLR